MSSSTWSCNVCTFVNHESLPFCEICETVRVDPEEKVEEIIQHPCPVPWCESTIEEHRAEVVDEWNCGHCRYNNPFGEEDCGYCGATPPPEVSGFVGKQQ